MNRLNTIEIVAFTDPSVFKPLAKREGADADKVLRYDRIVALWHKDGIFGRHVGAKEGNYPARTFQMPEIYGNRLIGAFDSWLNGRPFNCHRFGRVMQGLEDSHEEPILNFDGKNPTLELPLGAIGIIGVHGWGVPHTVGYGLGSESLQVLSGFGEFGIANNVDVVDFYRNEFPQHDVDLYLL